MDVAMVIYTTPLNSWVLFFVGRTSAAISHYQLISTNEVGLATEQKEFWRMSKVFDLFFARYAFYLDYFGQLDKQKYDT